MFVSVCLHVHSVHRMDFSKDSLELSIDHYSSSITSKETKDSKDYDTYNIDCFLWPCGVFLFGRLNVLTE